MPDLELPGKPVEVFIVLGARDEDSPLLSVDVVFSGPQALGVINAGMAATSCKLWTGSTEMPDRAVVETSGKRVRRARELRNRSLRSVADDAGVSPSTLSRWENGKGEPIFSHVARIAQALNISLDWLAGEGPGC